MVYIVTCTINIPPLCWHIYQHHGSYGIDNPIDPPGIFQMFHGTFPWAVVFWDPEVSVLSVAGDDHLGGSDFDIQRPGGNGYGSIPIRSISTIFRGMNIHKSQLFWGSPGVPGFDPYP